MSDPNFEQELEAAVDAAVDKTQLPAILKGIVKWGVHRVLPALFVELEALLKRWAPQPQDGGGPGPH